MTDFSADCIDRYIGHRHLVTPLYYEIVEEFLYPQQ